MVVRIKRVYDQPGPDDGYRVLIDRLWPRGVSRTRAAIEIWCKDVAPSDELRTWFDHRPDRYTVFATRYVAELDGNPAVEQLRAIARTNPTVTLVYAAKEQRYNNAVVLAEYLNGAGDSSSTA